MKKNYYQILQIDQNAEIDIIEVAYKCLARKYHPDTNNSSNATVLMQEINEAYETLKDELKRSQYNAEFLPKLSNSKNTNSAIDTEQKHKRKESPKAPPANLTKNKYKKTKTYKKAKQYQKPDEFVHAEWSKKSYGINNFAKRKQSNTIQYRESSYEFIKKGEPIKLVKNLATSIIIFNTLSFIIFGLLIFNSYQRNSVVNIEDNGWFILALPISLISIIGGIQMYRLKNYWLSLLSALSLSYTGVFCLPVSIFFVIRGSIILTDSQIKSLFGRNF